MERCASLGRWAGSIVHHGLGGWSSTVAHGRQRPISSASCAAGVFEMAATSSGSEDSRGLSSHRPSSWLWQQPVHAAPAVSAHAGSSFQSWSDVRGVLEWATDGEPHYRVRSSVDGHERALLESQIKAREERPAKVEAPPADRCGGAQVKGGVVTNSRSRSELPRRRGCNMPIVAAHEPIKAQDTLAPTGRKELLAASTSA